MKRNTTNRLQGSDELHRRLPAGALTMLADKYGVSRQYIYNVVTGRQNNRPGIIEDAIRLAEFGETMKEVI
jgi:hypothetical protein